MNGLISIEKNGYLYLMDGEKLSKLVGASEFDLKFMANIVIELSTNKVIKNRFSSVEIVDFRRQGW